MDLVPSTPTYLPHQNAEVMEVEVREMLHVDGIGIGQGRQLETTVFLRERERSEVDTRIVISARQSIVGLLILEKNSTT